jgi:Tol biopolymer transport system component/DNA-binding winged helix-turn-helix (wHTH) protein
MAETQSRPRLVRFGAFEADVQTGELRKDGVKLKFSGQPFQVLAILLERPGDVVTREELQTRLWPDTFVDVERNLNTAVNKIREVLGDSAESPRFVETLPRRGYRFIGEVEPTPPAATPVDSNRAANSGLVGSETPPQVPTQIDPTPKRDAPKDGSHMRFRGWVLTVAVLALFLASLGWYLLRPLPPPRISKYERLTHDGFPKMPAATDGNRLYLNQIVPRTLSQVPVAGGNVEPLPVPVNNPMLWDISPDGSTLLVSSLDGGKLVSVGVLGESHRDLANAPIGSAVWSPDGTSVAYSTDNAEIYRARSDGSEVQQFVSAEDQLRNKPALDLAWAPNGSTLRFSKDYELWEISSHGSNLHKLLPDWTPSTYWCCGHWTPDGDFFLFLSGDSLLTRGWWFPGTQLWALDERRGLLRRPSAQPIQLTFGPTRWGAPVPSKDGKKIFARGVTIRGELERYDSQSGEFKPFLAGISAEFLSFSNDGKSVAYVSFPEGILWKANSDGSNPVQLTDPPVYPKSIRWSPDDTRIAFTDEPAKYSNPETYVISSEGGKPQRLLPEVNEPMMDANWSPDGRKMVFSRCNCIDGINDSKIDIRVLDLASHQVTTLPGSEGMKSPIWSPNGRFIAVLSGALGDDPRVYDLVTKKWSILHIGRSDWPYWSHDSRSIYFLSGAGAKDPSVVRVSIQTGKIEKVVDLKGFQFSGWFGFWFSLDPTDAPLLLRNVGTEDIYALTLDRK